MAIEMDRAMKITTRSVRETTEATSILESAILNPEGKGGELPERMITA